MTDIDAIDAIYSFFGYGMIAPANGVLPRASAVLEYKYFSVKHRRYEGI